MTDTFDCQTLLYFNYSSLIWSLSNNLFITFIVYL